VVVNIKIITFWVMIPYHVQGPPWKSERVWNVMVHTQKPDLVFWWNRRIHLNRRGASVQSTAGSRGTCISGSNAGYTMFRDSVKGTGYPLHSPVSPSLPLLCVTVCHHVSTGLYHCWGLFSIPIGCPSYTGCPTN